MSKTILVGALAAAISIAAFAAAARSAHATFAGTNGRIAFTDASDTGTNNIFTMKPDGTDVRQLTFFDTGFPAEPSWSPDGRSIVFTVYSDNGPSRLYLMNAEGSNLHLLLSESPDVGDGQANWAPDGSRVIFRRCNFVKFEACTVSTVKPGGNSLNSITHFQQNDPGNAVDVKPEFSPDGSTISFSSFNRGGVVNGIYLMSAHGTGIHLITPTALEAVDADWSPNGQKIAFWTHCCDPQEEAIAVMNPDGSGITQLTHPGAEHDLRPSWSPQGDMIAFSHLTADFSSSQIEVIPAGGGVATVLHSGDDPSWGPAGS
jgi:Tol biopolymer transport system component